MKKMLFAMMMISTISHAQNEMGIYVSGGAFLNSTVASDASTVKNYSGYHFGVGMQSSSKGTVQVGAEFSFMTSRFQGTYNDSLYDKTQLNYAGIKPYINVMMPLSKDVKLTVGAGIPFEINLESTYKNYVAIEPSVAIGYKSVYLFGSYHYALGSVGPTIPGDQHFTGPDYKVRGVMVGVKFYAY